MSRTPLRIIAVSSAAVLLTLGATLSAGATARARTSAPLSVHARSAASAVRVSWSAPSSRGSSSIESYVVTAHPGGRTCTTKLLSCSVTGLTKGSTYNFTVAAKNRWGVSAASAPSNSVIIVAENGSPVSSVGS